MSNPESEIVLDGVRYELAKPAPVIDCLKCRRWQDCPSGHDNYTYAEIRWCPYQVLWLIENADILRHTGWLTRDDNKGTQNTPHDAEFVSVSSVLAELDLRIARCHTHGEKLRKQAEEGRMLKSLSPQALAALMYVKGWRRKTTPYTQWLREVYLKNPKIVAKFRGKPKKRS